MVFLESDGDVQIALIPNRSTGQSIAKPRGKPYCKINRLN